MLAGWTNFWRVWMTMFSDITQVNIDLHREYGPLARLGPRVMSISDPALIPIIYGVSGGFVETELFSVIDLHGHLTDRRHALFGARDEAYYTRILKPIANTYSLAPCSIRARGGQQYQAIHVEDGPFLDDQRVSDAQHIAAVVHVGCSVCHSKGDVAKR
jgi:hypothetical protein